MKLAEVVSLYDKNASDIPAMLREMADGIDYAEGAKPRSVVALVTEADGTITLYGWGETDSMNALATLHLAAAQHARAMLEDD